MKATTATTLLVALLVSVAGCSGNTSTHFVDPDADLPYYERVGVVPFESLTNDRAAGARVTNVFFTELLRTEFAVVAEPNQFAAAVAKVRGQKPPGTPWTTPDLQALQESADVQAVFMGTVRNYEMVQSGRNTYPMISLEVRLVDTATGRMVWSASQTKKESAGVPGFNWGRSRTLPDLATRVSRTILETLP